MEKTGPWQVARGLEPAQNAGFDPEAEFPPDARSTRPFYPNAPASATPPAIVAARKPPAGTGRRARRWVLIGWAAAAALLVALAIAGGAFAGLAAGRSDQRVYQQEQSQLYITEQYLMGVGDLEAGRYEVARQRFEFVLNKDPNYPGATEKLVEALQVLQASATPTNVPPTVAPTPTRDLRPVQDLFTSAYTLLATGDWNGVIDTLNNLRSADATYLTAKVDGMLFIALRYRGVDKILNQGDLGGGSYDLALAERFAPLDYDASTVREWARLYMYGSSFWEAYPEQAVYYFAQVAAAAPYLRDGSGWTARDRYRAALIQLADKLVRDGDWCGAQEQYALAQSIVDDGSLQATAVYAYEQCLSPETTEAAEMTATATLTPTLTATLPVIFPPTYTTEASATPTSPLPDTPSPSATTEPPTATSEPPTSEPPTPTLPLPPTPGGNVVDTPTPEATSSPNEKPLARSGASIARQPVKAELAAWWSPFTWISRLLSVRLFN